MATMPQQPSGQGMSVRGGMNLAMFIVRTWATSLEVVLHHGTGERYLGWQAAAVLLLVPIGDVGEACILVSP